MAGYEVSVGKDLLPGLLDGKDGLAKLVETVLNQILEAQVSEALQSQPTSAVMIGRATAMVTGPARCTRASGW